MSDAHRSRLAVLVLVCACEEPYALDEAADLAEEDDPTILPALDGEVLRARCDQIKTTAADRGITNPVVIAGIANHETHLVQCLSEWPIHCAGPHSNDCGGPVLAGSGDGPCGVQQGGLGMFQFDAGTYNQTLSAYGNEVLSVAGNIDAGIDVIIHKLRVCQHTSALVPSEQAAIDFINSATPGTANYEKYISSMASCYNGCQPHFTSCSHEGMRSEYKAGVQELRDAFGDEYWTTRAHDEIAAASSERIAMNADGRLELFALGSGGSLAHRWQSRPNHPFAGWGDLGGALAGAPVVSTSEDGRLEVFAIDDEGALAHRWQVGEGKWSDAWASLGSADTAFVGEIAVGRNADGRLEIFARTDDGTLLHKWQNGPNEPFVGDWRVFGDHVVSDPVLATNRDGRLEVFVRGADDTLHHAWQREPSAGWSAWGHLGGALVDAPAIGANADGRLEVFYVDADGSLRHRWQRADGGWATEWASLGGSTFVGQPVVGTNLDGRMEIVARTEDGGLWHLWQDDRNAPFADAWEAFGDDAIGDPQVARNADGRLEVFVQRGDGRVWHRWQLAPNQSWAAWEAFGNTVESF